MPVQVQTTKQISPLRRAFGLFGGLRLKLDETVVPVAIVEDLVQDEWRHCFIGDDRGLAGAGNRHIYQLQNPAGSGRIANLYLFSISSSGTGAWSITATATPYTPGTVLAPQFQDLDGLYLVPSSAPSCNVRHAAAAAALVGAVVWTGAALGNTQLDIPFNVTLHPGQVITLWQDQLNLECGVSLQWRERPLLSTER